MNLVQLRSLIAVADAGSIGAAGRALGVSQPAVTKSIRALESELGIALIRRTARGTEFTELGRTFLIRARSACQEIDRGREELAQATGGKTASVVLGAGSAAAAALLPGAINRLRAVLPSAEVRIIEGLSDTTLPRVRDGSLDFAIGPKLREPLATDVVATPLYRNEIAIVVRRGHPLAGARSLSELVNHDWLTGGLGGSKLIVDDMFHAAGLQLPRWAVHCQPIPGLIAIAARSDLIATIPKSLLTFGLCGNLLQTISVREHLAVSTICLFTKRDSPLPSAAARLARYIRDEAKGLRDQTKPSPIR